jgi:hypothetical protein
MKFCKVEFMCVLMKEHSTPTHSAPIMVFALVEDLGKIIIYDLAGHERESSVGYESCVPEAA